MSAKVVHAVVVQKWEESERNWGNRPDGYSLHLSKAIAQQYIKDYWAGMPDEVQDEYSRPDGTMYVAIVDDETYKLVVASGGSWRTYDKNYPGDQGPDGWKNLKVA